MILTNRTMDNLFQKESEWQFGFVLGNLWHLSVVSLEKDRQRETNLLMSAPSFPGPRLSSLEDSVPFLG